MRRIMSGLLMMGVLIASAAPSRAQDDEAQGREDIAQEQRVLYSSTFWKKGSNTIEGLYTCVERPDGTRIVRLGEDFRTKAGPDLKIVLSPRTFDQVTKKNVLDGGLVLGSLRSNEGAQEFAIPKDVKLDRYKSIAIHCEKYTKLWGAAPLSKGEVVASGGKWIKKTKTTKGRYEIVRRSDGMYIRFSADFKTANPPEPLRILLSPQNSKGASNENAEQEALFVAELKSTRGSQEYRLPDGVDLSKYRSVHLNCKKYTKLWSTVPLS